MSDALYDIASGAFGLKFFELGSWCFEENWRSDALRKTVLVDLKSRGGTKCRQVRTMLL